MRSGEALAADTAGLGVRAPVCPRPPGRPPLLWGRQSPSGPPGPCVTVTGSESRGLPGGAAQAGRGQGPSSIPETQLWGPLQLTGGPPGPPPPGGSASEAPGPGPRLPRRRLLHSLFTFSPWSNCDGHRSPACRALRPAPRLPVLRPDGATRDGCFSGTASARPPPPTRVVPGPRPRRPAGRAAHSDCLPASGLPTVARDGQAGAWRPTVPLVLPSTLGVPSPQCLLEAPPSPPDDRPPARGHSNAPWSPLPRLHRRTALGASGAPGSQATDRHALWLPPQQSRDEQRLALVKKEDKDIPPLKSWWGPAARKCLSPRAGLSPLVPGFPAPPTGARDLAWAAGTIPPGRGCASGRSVALRLGHRCSGPGRHLSLSRIRDGHSKVGGAEPLLVVQGCSPGGRNWTLPPFLSSGFAEPHGREDQSSSPGAEQLGRGCSPGAWGPTQQPFLGWLSASVPGVVLGRQRLPGRPRPGPQRVDCF
ncbi:collagen alpha-1(I) chain-like [Phyllostomus discolor]|uniref:Collagen alpha-1(I) chain-like n=1 Tax=Phyllostomus discolor TaxID=89673 RepID=A0A6J2L7L0_9CHIR|nr:collagen alpha-1(I) chain-like [Phyllostomus discolor]